MRSIGAIPLLARIPILVRASLNVPMRGDTVTGAYRLRRALPTLTYLSRRGARVVAASHLGERGTETLEAVASELGTLLPNVSFCKESVGPIARAAIRDLSPGHILVLENLRRNKGEVSNDPAFARELAALADVFVQDAFDTCHRAHASIVGIPGVLPSYAGLLLEEEAAELSRALAPSSPSLAVVGGAKFTTKESVLARLLETYDHVFVGGALANDFFKASGQRVGQSVVSGGSDVEIKKMLQHTRLVVPVDSYVVPKRLVGTPEGFAEARIAAAGADVGDDEMIVDHGPETIAALSAIAVQARTILWNGPLGLYESGYTKSTDAFATAVAASRARSIVGGGDTIASIERLNLLPQFSFVSTGGGAMLEFIARGTLPGIEALN